MLDLQPRRHLGRGDQCCLALLYEISSYPVTSIYDTMLHVFVARGACSKGRAGGAPSDSLPQQGALKPVLESATEANRPRIERETSVRKPLLTAGVAETLSYVGRKLRIHATSRQKHL